MITLNIATRLPKDLVDFLDSYARQHEWSRNYVIKKLLTQKMYELSGDLNG